MHSFECLFFRYSLNIVWASYKDPRFTFPGQVFVSLINLASQSVSVSRIKSYWSLQTLSHMSQRCSFLVFVCVVTWRTRPSGSLKLFSQIAHLYGFSLRCVCACFSNAAASGNSALHCLHFVSGWAAFLWAFNSLGIEKISLHSSHGIPARMAPASGWALFLWSFRSLDSVKTSEHWSHGKPFSEWLFMWDLRRSGRLKAFWQNSHVNGFTPEWVFLCLFKFPSWANFLSHWLHS